MQQRKKFSIMFVDDEQNILFSLIRLFRNLGYEIHIAENGEDALKKLAKKQVDLIVSDFRMPGMNGIEFLEEARRRNPSIKGIIISAYSDYSNLLRTLKYSRKYYPFISKPWDDEALKNMVRLILSEKLRASV